MPGAGAGLWQLTYKGMRPNEWVQWCCNAGIFVKTEILTPLVGCLQSTPESFSGNCFQWRRAALPKIKLQFREQSCLNWLHPSYWGFPDSSVGKESACSAGDPGLIPGSGRSAGEGIGYPLQHSWASLVAQLVKYSPALWDTWVRSLGWEDPLEKGKATTPVCWPGEFHELYSPWGHKELDTTEWLSLTSYWGSPIGLAEVSSFNYVTV